MGNGNLDSQNYLSLSIDDLFNAAYRIVEEKNINKLKDIDLLVKRYFCKKIANHQFEELDHLNKLMTNFLAWFEWGEMPRWDEACPIIRKWETVLDLSRHISNTESPEQAYKVVKKSPCGETLLNILYEKKLMQPIEIKDALNIKTGQQVSKLLSEFEKAGIIIKELGGPNGWVSLGKQGMAVYKKYIKPDITYMSELVIKALREYNNNEFEKAMSTLLSSRKSEPITLFLSGIINLEIGDLTEAGKLFTEASKFGPDKRSLFLLFFILEKMDKLDSLKSNLYRLYSQRDEISREILPSLQFQALLNEYSEETSRAKEYSRLRYVRF